ncbi:MAG: acyl-CoA dehydrogenase family protein [Desulfobacteraceae bacterium]|nr:acyl-CoA dehydrogenase family protein [Desulfobacteraceae bacterium]
MFDYLFDEKTIQLRDEIRSFVKSIPRQMLLDMDSDKINFPKEFLSECGKRNFFGCRYPVELGGRGLDWVATTMAMEEIGVLGYIMACVFGVGAELVCDAIVIHGSDEQKEKYVKPLLKGEIFAAECLTEPRGGSDFFGATTTAVDKGDYYLLNGQKRFIVGGEGADYFLVYAKTDPDAAPHEAMTCFIVDKGPGVESTYLYGLMGCRGGGASRIVFKDAKVPKENVLGRVNGALDVFLTMMIPERLGTAAMTIGAARPAIEIATGYTSRRKAFGKTINRYQGVSFQVAEATMLMDAARSMIYTTARAVDANIDPSRTRRMISQAKKFVTESCQKVVHNSMQVMGGIAYTNVYPIERIYRDIRLASIWTGTNEVMSMITASEWYGEYKQLKASGATRDSEPDALEAFAEDEKIYE